MRLVKFSVATLALFAVALAQAETRTIEGRGVAKNRDGVSAAFAVRVGQTNNDPARGRFEMSWMRNDAKIVVVSEHPRFVGVREHEGRFHGPAVVTVTKGNDTRRWTGTVYFTAWDLRNANNQNTSDKVRMRFIRNPWESPEGDFFFEGVLTSGDVVVRKV